MSEIIKNSKNPVLGIQYTLEITPKDLHLPKGLVQRLPKLIQLILKWSTDQTDAPDEFLLMSFFPIFGALLGQKRWFHLGGMIFYPVVWLVIFAGSSNFRKSTAIKIILGLIKTIEKNWLEIYKEELRQWKQRKKEAEQAKEPFDEPEPKLKTLVAPDDYSDLKFLETLAHCKHQVAIASEFTQPLATWLKPYNSLDDLMLHIFDAPDQFTRDTKSGGLIELHRPIYCIAGATTIGNFTNTIPRKHHASGLLQRIIPVYMESNPKPYKPLTDLPEPDRILYNQIVSALQEIARLSPKELKLSDEAKALSREWETALHQQSVDQEPYLPGIGGYTSRLNTYMLKFALMFQVMDDPDSDISRQNLEASIHLCEWILKHIIYMVKNHYVFNRSQSDRVKILKVLEQSGGMLDRTSLMNRSHLDKQSLDMAIENELEAGNIEMVKHERESGGRPLREYRLK